MSNHLIPDPMTDSSVQSYTIPRAPSTSAGPNLGTSPLSRFVFASLRWKWLLLGAAVFGLGAGIFAIRFVKSKYAAQGTIWVEGDNDRNGGNMGPIVASRLLASYAWIELLKSFAVLDTVVTREKLYLVSNDLWMFPNFEMKDRFRPGQYRFVVDEQGKSYSLLTPEGFEVERGPVGRTVGDTVGLIWTPPAAAWEAGRVVDFVVRHPREVAVELADGLETTMVEEGRFLRLALTGDGPKRVASTLNATMDRFVQVATELKRVKLDEVTEILESQRTYAERSLRDAEMELEGFRVQTITKPTEIGAPVAGGIQQTRDPVFNNFFEMKVDLEDLRRDRVALQNVLAQAEKGELTLDALNAIPVAQVNASLQGLLRELNEKRAELRAAQLKRYTNEHPLVAPVISTIANLEKNLIPTAVRDLQAQTANRERDLDSRIASASSELQQIPPRQIEEARLARRVEIANALHGMLRQRYEEARLSAVSSIADVRVLDRATPPSGPIKDMRLIIVAGFTAGAIGLALLAILLIDRADRRVRYPEQITSGMGLPILGAIPRARGGINSPNEDVAIQLTEASRELRLAVMHAYGAAGPLVISITSPESNDGKSTIARLLANAFTGQGHRVLLIDGDIRRGNLHRATGLLRSPGLTDYLAGSARVEDILQYSEQERFTLIGSGERMQAGPELLGSPAMAQLMRSLRSQYSVIIVDTPPLGAGVDAYVLGATTGNMLLVVRTGQTNSEIAETKLALLDRLPVRMLGAVLNDVPPSRLYRQYTYLTGYQVENETSVPVLAGAGSADGSSAAY